MSTQPLVQKTTDTVAEPRKGVRSPEEIERLCKLHDSYKPIWLTETIQLAPVLPSDKEALIKHLNDPRIYRYLYGPPNPYTPEDADQWIAGRIDRMTKNGTPLNLHLRDMAKGGIAIGSVTASDTSDDDLQGDDTGYWLDPEYHGKGLMAKALRVILRRISIDEVGKRKFNAHTFAENWPSRRTLEKAGFVFQPEIQKSHIVAGGEIKLWVYRMYLTDEDISKMEIVEEAVPLPSLIQ
ncbi:hypothetical protein BGX21_009122 [Mortierella sp. AD011]|nr:hypothetical protein BGX20_009564 [Mortierella sp. AD010]KAF9402678.1 hypothetical protein BGX21_009122 [Mortierella sp. AD011]